MAGTVTASPFVRIEISGVDTELLVELVTWQANAGIRTLDGKGGQLGRNDLEQALQPGDAERTVAWLEKKGVTLLP